MQKEVYKKDEKKEGKYCRAVAKQVDAAIKHRQKATAALSRHKVKTRRKMEARQRRAEEKRERTRMKAIRKRAWNVKRSQPIPAAACGVQPAYLLDMPQREEPGRPGGHGLFAPAQQADFLRAFWLTALLLLCPLLALWGMGEAYAAVRANGFADFTTPLALPDAADGGLRIFDFWLEADGLAAPVRIFLDVLWRLWSPAVRLAVQLLELLPAAIRAAAVWITGSM